MHNNLFISIIRGCAITLSIIVASGCIKEDNVEAGNLTPITITVGMENTETKAGFGEEYPKPEWYKGDEMAVMGELTGKQKFTALSSGAISEFEGRVDLSDNVYYAVYPYDADVALPTQEEKEKSKDRSVEIMRVTIPQIQYATPGSFDPKAFAAVAKSTNTDFQLKSAGGMLKFKLGEDGDQIKSVTITANNNDNGSTVSIAGTVGVSFDENGTPNHGVSGTWGKSSNTIKLIEKEGNEFRANGTYFIVTRANSFPKGITVKVEYDNGIVYSRSSTNVVFHSGARNHIVNLGTFDKNYFTIAKTEYPLLDFSYAGYKYSETAPPAWETLGYKVYDVTDYGAVANDGISDREAFLNAVSAATGVGYQVDKNIVFNHKNSAKAVIYFPEGEFILHTKEDDVNGKSQTIQIRTSDIIIRGAGRDKTTIVMEAPNQPESDALYSSPTMLLFKHNSEDINTDKYITTVSEDAVKGSHSITVKDAGTLKEGQWVCLYVKNNNSDFVAETVSPYTAGADWTITKNGVIVRDYHKIKEINGNTITFHEPVMTEVKAEYGWKIFNFYNYENIGIEDLTFRGNAKKDFAHHGSWEDDGAYKPIDFQRVTNSWIRRVNFESTSEACSIIQSANVSAYDIVLSGARGHSAIRSQESSRVFIAATKDITEDNAGNKGNFHAVGVSKHSIGTVLWRNAWGDDACFESHANQPRATLIDCCSGGWHKGHMGGSYYEAPHHLSDLVIWNFTATKVGTSNFQWWDNASWRFLPPVIAGFKGDVSFDETQTILIDNEGIISLFEQQLYTRLGYLPTWITELKSTN